MLDKLKTQFLALPSWLRGTASMIVAIAIAAAVILRWVIVPIGDFVEDRTNLWLREARHASDSIPSPALPQIDLVAPLLADRLTDQLSEVQASARYHVVVAQAFFRYHYVALTIAATAAVLAGVLLVPISWAGWKDVKPHFRVMFVVFAALAVLFRTYMEVYNQRANIDANTALYYGYLQLEDEMLSYVPRLEAGDTLAMTPVAWVREVDRRLGELRSFAVALDASRIPTSASIAEQLNVPSGVQSNGN